MLTIYVIQLTAPEQLLPVVFYEGSLVWMKCQPTKEKDCELGITFEDDSATRDTPYQERVVLAVEFQTLDTDKIRMSIGTGRKRRHFKYMFSGSKIDLRALITSRELICFNGQDTLARLSFQDLWDKWDRSSYVLSSNLTGYNSGVHRGVVEQFRWGGRKGGYPSLSFFRNLTATGLQPGDYNYVIE